MPDLTMCDTNSCELRTTCYRFMAAPSTYQSWAHWEPKKGKCDGYIEAISKSQVRRLAAQPRKPLVEDQEGRVG